MDSRGVAISDLNSDGLLDLAINNNNSAPTIYLNRTGLHGNWLQLELVGRWSNRDAIGAQARVVAGGAEMLRHVEAGAGYASQSTRILHFGLGNAEQVEEIEIRWPSGRVQKLERAQLEAGGVNRRLRVSEDQDLLTTWTQKEHDAGPATAGGV